MTRYDIYVKPEHLVPTKTSDPRVAGFARSKGCYVRCFESKPMKIEEDVQEKMAFIHEMCDKNSRN